MFIHYDGDAPYWIDYYLDESFTGLSAPNSDAVISEDDSYPWLDGSVEALNEAFIGLDAVSSDAVISEDDVTIYPAWFDGEALDDTLIGIDDVIPVNSDGITAEDDSYAVWFDGSIEALNESFTGIDDVGGSDSVISEDDVYAAWYDGAIEALNEFASSEPQDIPIPPVAPDLIPFWRSWHLYDWVQKKKKHDDEISLKEVAKNIVELIDDKPKSKLAKQFKAAIERQQDIDKQRISTENAYAYIQELLNTRAAYEQRVIVEAELQMQFDIDEEEAILLLL